MARSGVVLAVTRLHACQAWVALVLTPQDGRCSVLPCGYGHVGASWKRAPLAGSCTAGSEPGLCYERGGKMAAGTRAAVCTEIQQKLEELERVLLAFLGLNVN